MGPRSRFEIAPVIGLLLWATPALSFNATSIAHDITKELPTSPGSTVVDEIKCYGLPYGGLGFASHILTYYTVYMLSKSVPRNPLRPWKKSKHWVWNFSVSLLGLLGTILIAVITMIRCRNRWQFITITVWKMILSTALGFTSLSSAWKVRKLWKDQNIRGEYQKVEDDEATEESSPILRYTILLYILGVFTGLSGLMSLVAQTIHKNEQVLIITIVFGTVIATVLVAGTFFLVWGNSDGSTGKALGIGVLGSAMQLVMWVAILAAFYSDWILGAIAGSLSGVPSSDVAPLYYSYLIVKRLPLFSF
jgi:hypothetical protein